MAISLKLLNRYIHTVTGEKVADIPPETGGGILAGMFIFLVLFLAPY
jgi:hypothetical protein